MPNVKFWMSTLTGNVSKLLNWLPLAGAVMVSVGDRTGAETACTIMLSISQPAAEVSVLV